ncbi:hypothetical protein ACG04R_16610 [Roseateles sp. BYS78W]|uniref:Uncharacterized protein n=1 Tax=Pelomonas candidula TaxID=3299025 RepID=A0ABW7HF31_9BURK
MEQQKNWTLSVAGTLDDIRAALAQVAPAGVGEGAAFRVTAAVAPEVPALAQHRDLLAAIPTPYGWRDVAPFAPSAAVYFMDGYSNARIRLRGSGEELFLEFWDRNTSIAASAPQVYEPAREESLVYTPVPPPLQAYAKLPEATPDRYRQPTSQHLMQVVSMNMKAKDSGARLLIGLPYAEGYPELFFRKDLFGVTRRDTSAASYGVVHSLTDFTESNGDRTPHTNGYPARSFFAIYHLIETPIGALFNKKATQMELQPGGDGKLALKLPPIPFKYSLINAPIPLHLASDPDGEPVADLVSAMHHDGGAAAVETSDAWPWHRPDLERVAAAQAALRAE